MTRKNDSAQSRASGRREPPVVAELGRPETLDETAARKAETSRKHRSNQTTLNLVVALAASLGIVLLLVLVVVRPQPEATEPIDYNLVASQAQPSVDEQLASPQLDEQWRANSARIATGSDDITSWYIGFITPEDQFIALRQGIDANPTWLATQLDNSTQTGVATIDDITWQLYDNRDSRDDPGNLAYAMTAELHDSTFVLFGTAPDSEFELLAKSISEELQKDGK